MIKRRLSTVLLLLAFFAGLSLLLYPSVSNYWNARHATRAISTYIDQIADLNEEQYKEMWAAAEHYNQLIAERNNVYLLSENERVRYEELLNLAGDGLMGYIEIEKLQVSLPIYHGTEDRVLQRAVGHLEWTSLPVGGESTHSVFSGHRGLPSARLFTDLDQMQEGDVFTLHILNEVLTYEVDQVRIVEPRDTADLQIAEGADYCTLVTCTPYGINTHRLLVRGRRIETAVAHHTYVVSEALVIEPLLVAPVLLVPILLLLLVLLFARKKK